MKKKNVEKKYKKPIDLYNKLLELGYKEATFEEFQSYKQYSFEGCAEENIDPRWRNLKFKLFQKGDNFLAIFEKNGNLHSFLGHGVNCVHEDGFYVLLHDAEWHDDRTEDEIWRY